MKLSKKKRYPNKYENPTGCIRCGHDEFDPLTEKIVRCTECGKQQLDPKECVVKENNERLP